MGFSHPTRFPSYSTAAATRGPRLRGCAGAQPASPGRSSALSSAPLRTHSHGALFVLPAARTQKRETLPRFRCLKVKPKVRNPFKIVRPEDEAMCLHPEAGKSVLDFCPNPPVWSRTCCNACRLLLHFSGRNLSCIELETDQRSKNCS